MSVVRYERADAEEAAWLPTCFGKAAFTYDVADRVARSMRNRGKKARAFACGHCACWHVGGGAQQPNSA